MSKNILLTGPSGAGKTTTSKAFLAQAEGVWAYINQDDIRGLIKTGYASAGDYSHRWNADTKNQWAVSIPICIDMIKHYNAHNINCLVDLFAPKDEIEQWEKELKEVDYSVVTLLPDEETTVARNANRNEIGRLKENKIRHNHSLFATAQIVDALELNTSSLSLNDVIEKLNEL